MNREEILQKSRLENRGKDVADIEISKNGIRAGWLALICVTMIVCIVDYLAFGRMCFELLFAVYFFDLYWQNELPRHLFGWFFSVR